MEAVWVLALTLTLIIIIRVCLRWGVRKCPSNVSMEGKVVIVTGANTGIGFYTAEGLARRGARVILACRDPERGKVARDTIVSATGNSNVHFRQLDLASLASVRSFASNIIDTEQRLHVLVNNAGTYGPGDRYTKDGIIDGMQVNYFGPFLLTLLLLPLLKRSQPSRIVHLSSVLHFLGSVNLRRINQKGWYSNYFTYCNSKLCNLIFSVELARRLEGTGVVSNAVHPGVIWTGIVTPFMNFFMRFLFKAWCWIYSRTAEDGAQTVIYLSAAEECANVNGGYYVDYAKRYTSYKSWNKATARDLWDYSEKIVGYE